MLRTPLGMVIVAILLNIVTVVLIRVSDGAKLFWPVVGIVLTIVPCQLLLARATGPGGAAVAPTISVVVVAVLAAAAGVGLCYGEKLTWAQVGGLLLAAVGAAVSQLAGAAPPANQAGG